MSARVYPARPTIRSVEHRDTFDCFGGRCTVVVADAVTPDQAAEAAHAARTSLLDWHARFSRFAPDSELSRLNRDPRATVPVSPLMARLIEAAVAASVQTGGVVDATLSDEIERAGYAHHFDGDGIGLAAALALAPPRAPASARPDARWREVTVDRDAGTATRPPGLRIDPGGIAKGLFADELSTALERFDAYAIDCAGDLRIGGRAGLPRPIRVAGPFDESTLYTFHRGAVGVATSGIGKRSWIAGGLPAHHLLDPATGRPAFTGVVQATALAPTAAEAEALAKAALLSGPVRAAEWLPYGGVVVFDDGGYEVLEPVAAAPERSLAVRAASQAQMSSSTSSRSGSFRISWNRPS